MKAFLGLVCLHVIAVAVLCFFGQLFVGRLLPTAMAMGLAGLAAASGALTLNEAKARRRALWGGLLGVLAVAADVANYYAYLAIPGNYYPWGMFVPYAISLAFIAACAIAAGRTPAGPSGTGPRSP